MTPSFEALQKQLRRLPGVGYRSAERMAAFLLLEKPESAGELARALLEARERTRSCAECGNLSEGEEERCAICLDERRRASGQICVVERVSDALALEKAGAYQGLYHVLHGKLSPIEGIGPDELNLASLLERVASGAAWELILALPNDIEGEATCHYICERLPAQGARATRIGFGLPSGGAVLYADPTTLKSALEARRSL